MIWAMAILLALCTFLVLAFVLKAPRSGWEAVGAALFLGIAGYGLQASPGLSGAPKPAAQTMISDPAAIVESRLNLSERDTMPDNKWVVIADGMARNGQFANAAQVLLGAVDDDPDNAEAWLAMGNALLAHADGLLTPASLYAYRKAEKAAPDSPGPPFFLGTALAQSGRFVQARSTWAALLERTAPDAPWREGLEYRLQRLDLLIEAQAQTQIGR
ncbi:MAG: tetratricopeptide repeat protein [Sphingomonadaceae bacterium]|nr:tetratricopeptide repeat protein [Sphingomonadaceae bacterium]